jgi:hypothetical protein
MAAIIPKREAITLLRRVATKGITEEDSKLLRIYATQLQKEVETHNEVARNSRNRRIEKINTIIMGLTNG